MSEERVAGIENQVTQLSGKCDLLLDSFNAFMNNIPTPPPPRDGAHHGRGRRDRGLMGRGRAQGGREEQAISDSEYSMYEAFQRDSSKDLKVEIPDFYGSLNPEDLFDWFRTIERVFELKDYSDHKAFKVAILKFKGYASHWYENLKYQRRRDGKEPIKSWLKLKKKLNEKFVPKDYTQDMIRLTQLKQDQKPIESYLREFEKLTLQCEFNERPEQKIVSKVRMHQVLSFDETMGLALRVEKLGKGEATTTKEPSKTAPYQEQAETKVVEPPPQNRTPTLDKGKAPMTSHKNNMALKKCYHCQGFGHFVKDCPTKRALSSFEVIHWGEYEILVCDDEMGEREQEEVNMVVEPDSGLSLVIQRALNTQPLEMDQRLQLFRSRCTIEGKVCTLIIDGGSCANVASTTLVEKLSLPTQDHPNPHKLKWLNKGAEIRVDKQCLVSFSIGKDYVDEVLCDVLPMDACHILLGRPWEFDKNSMHHGRDNTYTFERGKRKVILAPLPPSSISEPSMETFLINEAIMCQGLNDMGNSYALLAKDRAKEPEKSWPRDVQEPSKSYGGKLLNEPPSEESTPKRIEPRVKLKPGTIWGKESVHGGPHDSIQVQSQQAREFKSKEKRCEAPILAQGNVNGNCFERRDALPQVFKTNCGLERKGNEAKNQVVPLSKGDQGPHKLNDQAKSSFGGLLFGSPTISVPILTNSFGNGETHLLPFTILVYDLGGSHESHLLKYARCFDKW